MHSDARSVAPPPADLRTTLRADLVSGFLVFLIALPLCLGIAMASGFPPIAGIITAVVGGVISTWVGSARLTIKGPAAGLIVIAIGAVTELGQGDAAVGYRRALAVGVVAAVIQIALALFRAGKLGDFFPSSVVHGMLAAIGVIIVAKQAHTLMGVKPEAKEPLHLLAEIPNSVAHANPEIFLIGAVSLLILFGLPRLPFRWAKKVPAPMLVLLVSVPLGILFDLAHQHTYSWNGHDFLVGPSFLVQLPGHLASAIAFPDFSAITSGVSIKYVVMFALVGSIESVLSAKAVDSLDPEKRTSDLDRDLLAVGVGNLVASLIGGLPMISEIVRSSANIDSGARTRNANFFHGLLLLAFVALVPGLLQKIPLAALGAMLIFTGLRLASPSAFVHTWKIGAEQLLVFTTTLVVTLATDLLVGVAAGIVVKSIVHLKNGAPISSLFRPEIEITQEDQAVVVRIRRSALFTSYVGIKSRLEGLTQHPEVVIDLAETYLVDHTVIEKLHHMVDEWSRAGRVLRLRGLEGHEPLSAHPLAARRRRAGAALSSAELGTS